MPRLEAKQKAMLLEAWAEELAKEIKDSFEQALADGEEDIDSWLSSRLYKAVSPPSNTDRLAVLEKLVDDVHPLVLKILADEHSDMVARGVQLINAIKGLLMPVAI